MSERQLQDAVVHVARLSGWRVYHPWSAMHSAPGFPDLTLVRRGRLLFIELKRHDGELRPNQAAWLAELAACGAEVYIWRPDVLEHGEALRVLRSEAVMGDHGLLAQAVVRRLVSSTGWEQANAVYGVEWALAVGATHPEYLAALVKSFRSGFSDPEAGPPGGPAAEPRPLGTGSAAWRAWVEIVERVMSEIPAGEPVHG